MIRLISSNGAVGRGVIGDAKSESPIVVPKPPKAVAAVDPEMLRLAGRIQRLETIQPSAVAAIVRLVDAYLDPLDQAGAR